MCGRYNLRLTPTELQEFFDLFRKPDDYEIRYNIPPTAMVPVIRQTDEGRVAFLHKWGLMPSWADPKDAYKMINARSETITEKPAYRNAFKKRRCLVPISGFFEWQKITTKNKQPWYITGKGDTPLAIAGIYESVKKDDGVVDSVSVITTGPNELMEQLHDRMPVFLGREQWDLWLDPDVPAETLLPLLCPCPSEWLTAWMVSDYVNKVGHEGPKCIEKISKGLFDAAV
jgi:putative SOS response-associated peptidase YedK